MVKIPDSMCSRCDGLCCRVYDIFDQSTGRRVKTADDKCGYLDSKNNCRIHATRDRHAGYRDSCAVYDCMEGGPIVTLFARRIGSEYTQRNSIIASLLETIRLRIVASPLLREEILLFVAAGLNNIVIDESLSLSVKIFRIKIERYAL